MKTLVLLTAAALALPVSVLAQGQPAASAPAAAPQVKAFGGRVADSISGTATVDTVNAQSREVTLRLQNGEAVTFIATPEWRNFDQIKPGDKVTIDLSEQVTIVVTNVPGEPERVDSVDVVRAPKGDKPGLLVTKKTKGSAVVEAIDYEKRTAVLRGPKRTVTIEAGPEAVNFKDAKVGDRVLIDYTLSLLVLFSAGG